MNGLVGDVLMMLHRIVNLSSKRPFDAKWCVVVACVRPLSRSARGRRIENVKVDDGSLSANGVPTKEILDDAMKGEKPLGLTGRFEATHLMLPLAG